MIRSSAHMEEDDFVHRLILQLLRLEAAVLISALILTAMVMYGTTRRPKGDRLLCSVMWGAYSLSYGVVAYAIGLVNEFEAVPGEDPKANAVFYGDKFTLWATALLLIQASVYAAPGQNRRDLDQRKTLLLHHVLQTGLVLWLVVHMSRQSDSFGVATWAFWSINVLKTSAKLVEVFKARVIDPSVEVVAEYMELEIAVADQHPADPKTMEGYKYLFHGEATMQLRHDEGGRLSLSDMLTVKSVATIDQVYRWIDAQGGHSEVEKSNAKDFCLAFTLFKLLKRRFYGYIPAEAGSPKSLDLVLTGLLRQEDAAAAFRVVQAELAFLYDFFYTRNIVLAGATTHILIAILVLGLSMWMLGPLYYRLHVNRLRVLLNTGVLVTAVIITIIAALELYQAVVRLYNSWDWEYIETVYRCVRDNRPWSKRHLWRKKSISPPKKMYWEDKISGYVLLKRFNHRPWNVLSWLTLDVVKPLRQGQKKSRAKELPLEVRRAVLDAIKERQGHLTNGVSTMQRYGLLQLTWACRLRNITDQILVWHVVTTRCDWAIHGDHGHRLVATKLSNYCAYLVAFVPKMLPDPSYNAEQSFDSAVRRARGHFGGCKTQADILAQLDKIQSKEESFLELEGGDSYERARSSSTIIEKAALLGGQLTASVPDDERRWEVLAEFWAEFILFLAPSDDVDIHAEMVGAGGEFMTQLWALLSHAGILERPAVATSSTPTT